MPELAELATQCRSRMHQVRDQLAMGIDDIHRADRGLHVAHRQLRGAQELHLRFLEALRVVDRHSASVGTDFGDVMSWALDAVAAYEKRVDDLERRMAADAARMALLKSDLRALEPFIEDRSNLLRTDNDEENSEIECRSSTRLAS